MKSNASTVLKAPFVSFSTRWLAPSMFTDRNDTLLPTLQLGCAMSLTLKGSVQGGPNPVRKNFCREIIQAAPYDSDTSRHMYTPENGSSSSEGTVVEEEDTAAALAPADKEEDDDDDAGKAEFAAVGSTAEEATLGLCALVPFLTIRGSCFPPRFFARP